MQSIKSDLFWYQDVHVANARKNRQTMTKPASFKLAPDTWRNGFTCGLAGEGQRELKKETEFHRRVLSQINKSGRLRPPTVLGTGDVAGEPTPGLRPLSCQALTPNGGTGRLHRRSGLLEVHQTGSSCPRAPSLLAVVLGFCQSQFFPIRERIGLQESSTRQVLTKTSAPARPGSSRCSDGSCRLRVWLHLPDHAG